MALPPSIPTSFVPHTASSSAHQYRARLVGVFGVFAYGVLAVAFVLALVVFLYGRILASSKAAKDTELASAQAAIDPATVENFVRLRDRLSSSETLLAGHPAFSDFFSAFEKLLPANVRFTSLHLSLGDGGVTKVVGAGVAKSFNALAATSNSLAADGRIKDAIFSNISVNPANSFVSFTLAATLDPKITAFTPTAQPAPAPEPPQGSVSPAPQP